MRTFRMTKENWVCGVSDGLTLPCVICKKKLSFDYNVEDDLWNAVVPKKLRPDVICLPCFVKLAQAKCFEDVGNKIRFVQFTAEGFTVEFIPANVFYYDDQQPVMANKGDLNDQPRIT